MAGTTPIPVYVPVPDPDVLLAAGWTSIRLERAASRSGPWATVVTTRPILTTETGFVYQDAAGSPSDWYRYAPWDGASYGTFSDPFPALGIPYFSGRQLIRKAAQEIGLWGKPPAGYTLDAPSGTLSAVTSTKVMYCAQFVDEMLSRDFGKGWYFSPLDGAVNIDQDRRVYRIRGADGGIELSQALPGLPAVGERFDFFKLESSSTWLDCLNRAGRDVWGPFQYTFGTVEGLTEYTFPPFVRASQIRSIQGRSGTEYGKHILLEGPDFELLQPTPGGGVTIQLYSSISGGNVYVIEGMRRFGPLATTSETLAADDDLADMLALSCAAQFAEDRAQGVSGIGEDKRYWRDQADRLWQRAATLGHQTAAVTSAVVKRSPMGYA